MKRKIRRKNRWQNFLLSRRFATILIGLGFGLAFAGLLTICLFEGWKVVLGGAGFGLMFACYYNGLMCELALERERRRVYRVGGARR